MKSLEYETANINPELESHIAPTPGTSINPTPMLQAAPIPNGINNGYNGSNHGYPDGTHGTNGTDYSGSTGVPGSPRTEAEIIRKMNGV